MTPLCLVARASAARKLRLTGAKGAHIRLEESVGERLNADPKGSPSPGPAVALGVCLREISLGLDSRASGEAGGAIEGKWFGRKFRKMETAFLGNYCEPISKRMVSWALICPPPPGWTRIASSEP